MGRLAALSFVVLAMSLVAAGPAWGAETYTLVVNAANPTSSLSRRQIADIFLGKASKWPDGRPAVAVEQSTVSPIRAAFSRDVLGKSVDEVINYWQQIVFSGRGVPPKTKASDQEVLEFVAGAAGGVGYVAAGTSVERPELKVLHRVDR